jgi:hypothetical protein
LTQDLPPLRFQIKPYDERVSRLRIFIQEECQYLQDYHRLRQSPERFKPKELFFAVGSRQAQEETETKLHSFEIENDRIRCSAVSSLQALIPYLKRSLQLFPISKGPFSCSLSQTVPSAVSYLKRSLQLFPQMKENTERLF